MRILLIAEVFLPKIDGVVHRTMNLIQQLVRKGDEVMVVCPEADGCRDCVVPVVAFPSFCFPLYPEYRVGLPDERLLDVVKRFAPDVLHFINPFGFGFRCYDVLQRSGVHVPSVFSFHTLYGEFVKKYRVLRPLSWVLWWLMREYHNRADMNLTVSGIMKEELSQRRFERVELWPPAVDGRLFRPAAVNPALRARLAKGHEDKRLLLTVSRLAPEKNVGFLAEVLAQLPEACLAIVGDGPQREALEARFAGANANFIGYLTGEHLAAAYASADAFIYASETETMGNVVMEAMASGCAVVAPRAGGIPSLVDHGNTGMLYAPGCVEEAVCHTRKLLVDEGCRSRLKESARRSVEERGWSRSVEQVCAVYRQAIERHQPAKARETWRQRCARITLSALISTFKAVAEETAIAAEPAVASFADCFAPVNCLTVPDPR
jgi:glycosyltransferase involved in cell wall biosynthesis